MSIYDKEQARKKERVLLKISENLSSYDRQIKDKNLQKISAQNQALADRASFALKSDAQLL